MTEPEQARDIWNRLLAVAGEQDTSLDVTSLVLDRVSSLPFSDQSASLVINDMGLHNCPDVPHALQEMVRVCQPGGYVAVSDDMTPEDWDAAAYINAWHARRAPTYQWAYSQLEWRELIQRSGLCLMAEHMLRQQTHLLSWSDLAGIGPEMMEVMGHELVHAPPIVREFLNVKLDGGECYFDQVQGFWLGRKC